MVTSSDPDKPQLNPDKSNKKRIGIPLLGKGATNHLHRQQIVDALNNNGFDVFFIVREDYKNLLIRLQRCEYTTYRIPLEKGFVRVALSNLRSFRRLYPSTDLWRQTRHKILQKTKTRVTARLGASIVFFLARFMWVMKFAVWLEGLIYALTDNTTDLDSYGLDILLLLSVGSFAQPHDCRWSWWARHKNIPAVHVVGNYDGLSSNGFRGFPIRMLLVWGRQMYEDAINRQGISSEYVKIVGPQRYNMIPQVQLSDRSSFLESVGLNPDNRVIVFGGSSYEYHYFEFIEAFKTLQSQCKESLQLILRVYPNKRLLDSPFLGVLLDYLKAQKDVWVSIGDPNFKNRETGTEVIQIDEDELWKILNAADVVVNIFSTLALEACMFNKPVIHMWYFLPEPRAICQPVYFPSNTALHNRRAIASDAVVLANSRQELTDAIVDSLQKPDEKAKQRALYVENECGLLDGKAMERLSSYCLGQVNL